MDRERRTARCASTAPIYVSRATQKAIIIGEKGSRIRTIGQSARIELTKLLDRPVHLFLNVKERDGLGRGTRAHPRHRAG